MACQQRPAIPKTKETMYAAEHASHERREDNSLALLAGESISIARTPTALPSSPTVVKPSK
jgi:hypothetical protein